MISNTAFYPALMWNARFFAPSGDPFQNSQGFTFPAPEGSTRFPPSDPLVTHLLMAQGQLPPTEQIEVAGFTGTKPNSDPSFDQFDDGKGSVVPPPDASGFRNEPIRQALLRRLNALPAYRAWLASGGGYQVIPFADDASRWVLRLGDEGDRYVHVHPARRAPATRRVRANVLKTAVMVLAYTGVRGGDPIDRTLVNAVRHAYLGLSPMGKDLAGDRGIGGVIDLLR